MNSYRIPASFELYATTAEAAHQKVRRLLADRAKTNPDHPVTITIGDLSGVELIRERRAPAGVRSGRGTFARAKSG